MQPLRPKTVYNLRMANAVVAARAGARRAEGDWLALHWFEAFAVAYGLWVLLPWLAPVFMHLGWEGAGRGLYALYSVFCHQLPERSYFLFGQQAAYSLDAIQAAWQDTANPLILRKFVGTEPMGWKVAWSDRMISFYSSVWLIALGWRALRRRIRPLPGWAFVLLLIPLMLDGVTHAISDLSGIGLGFRDSNSWLALLTGEMLPNWFYSGDGLGSFNSWARLVTGVLGGLGIVWFVFPHTERAFEQE